MKTLILGGGPGGLYAALLLKKAHPSHDVQLYERNPDGATYGWGVVFSDRTLNAFREADFPTYEQITESFVHWTAIDIYYREEVVRADGHNFAGMSRRRLLQILQDRCRELGVQLSFEHEGVLIDDRRTRIENRESNTPDLQSQIADSRTFAPGVTPVLLDPHDYDLVIAADGVNSATRTQFSQAFQPSLVQGEAKFIWFGTSRLLDAFTFIFKENEHGLFQVHAYPFDGETSTFIVECAEEVWKRAGLDQANEADSIAYCQRLFADFLHGAELLSNRSLWINFMRIKNKTWRHENIVLLGDAAHTAHFSIGSGTKLAMDGAIALAQALETAPDLGTALRLYEMERRPRVQILQQAAQESRVYFENIKRYTHLEPQQFAFNLLTRSGRIHYDNLRTRDPRYADHVDRWYGGDDRLSPPPMFAPFRLAGLDLPNRVVSSRVNLGAGLAMSPPLAVSPEGRITPEDPGMYEESHVEQWKTFVQKAHAQSTKAGIFLNHAGRRGAAQPRRAGLDRPLRSASWPQLAPSPLPYQAGSQTPRAMSTQDMARLRASFVRAAQLAGMAGFDLLQLHMAHGYLLASFLSPLTNRREDDYGGSLENRLRFPLEVFDALREAWPHPKPLSVALNAHDFARGGQGVEEAVQIARILQAHGCDLFHILAGQTTPRSRPPFDAGWLTNLSDQLRQEAGVATMVGGYLTTSGEVNTILAGGRADLCILSNL